MKKIRATIDRYFDQLDKRWQALPLRKQHQFTLYFFVGYLLLTVVVIGKVIYDTGASENNMHIKHIETPFINSKKLSKLYDSILTILKNKMYERK